MPGTGAPGVPQQPLQPEPDHHFGMVRSRCRVKGSPFETAIIERSRRRESSVEETLIEMYLAGVSVRWVEDITEALWGSKKYMNMKRLEDDLEDASIAS